MELTQLRYFIRLAEVLNFTEASKQLFITQSTLSQSIRQTESELGTPLFERIGKKVYLTDAGQAFLPYARQSIIETETGIQKLRDMQQIYKGELRIGVIYSLCPMLAESIVRFSKEYPGIKLILTQSTSINDMTTMLHNNEVDFALAYKLDALSSLTEKIDLCPDPLCVIVHRRSPLASQQKISIQVLTHYPLALLKSGSYTRNVIENVASRSGISLQPMAEINDTNLLLQMVRTGDWISVLSQHSVDNQPDLKAVPLKEKGGEMHVYLFQLKGRYKKLVTRKFIEIIQKVMSQNNLIQA